MNLGLEKQVGEKLNSLSLCLFSKAVQKTTVILDESYITEPSAVWMRGRET